MPNITLLAPELPLPINTVTANTYTLALTDQQNGIFCTNTTNIAVTIANNATIALPLGSQIPIRQGNTGTVVISGATGVTLLTANGANTSGTAGDVRVIEQVVINTWIVY